eukprot:Pgem_evm1s12903
MLMISEDLMINVEIKNSKDNDDEYVVSDDDSEGDDKGECKNEKDEIENRAIVLWGVGRYIVECQLCIWLENMHIDMNKNEKSSEEGIW